MSALKEKPKLNKADAQIRDLAKQATMVDGFQDRLVVLVLRRIARLPDHSHNFIQIAADLRRQNVTCATDYNVKKTIRFMTEHGVVSSYPQNMIMLTQDMKQLIFEVAIKNAKNRSKRQRLPSDPVHGSVVLSG